MGETPTPWKISVGLVDGRIMENDKTKLDSLPGYTQKINPEVPETMSRRRFKARYNLDILKKAENS